MTQKLEAVTIGLTLHDYIYYCKEFIALSLWIYRLTKEISDNTKVGLTHTPELIFNLFSLFSLCITFQTPTIF